VVRFRVVRLVLRALVQRVDGLVEFALTVVERGERLPRKSTFYWPKPRTGMVMMPVG